MMPYSTALALAFATIAAGEGPKADPFRETAAAVEAVGGTAERSETRSVWVSVHLQPEPGRDIVPALRTLHRLEGVTLEVELEGAGVGNEALAALDGLATLQQLRLTATGVTDEGLARLKALKGLTHLGIYETRITGVGFCNPGGLSGLCDLSLNGTPVTDEGLARVGQLTGLRTLSLQDTEISDVGLAHLAGLQRLGTLSLYQDNIRGPGIKSLGRLPHLTRLYLTEPLDDEGMVAVAALRGLKELHLAYDADLGDASYARLGALNGLGKLSILNGEGIGEEALAGWGGLGQLYELELGGPRITDAGIQHLAGLKRLDRLTLRNSSVTPRGAKELKKSLPGLSYVELVY